MEEPIIKAFAGQGPAWTLLGLAITAFIWGVRWAKPWAEELLRTHIDMMKAMSMSMPAMANDIAEIKEKFEGKFGPLKGATQL